MSTQLDVWNGALDRIGQTPIASIDLTDVHSRRLRRRTPEMLREAGEAYPFNWCMTREQLTAATDSNGDALTSLSHDYIYELPGWRLRTVGYSWNGTDSGMVRTGWRVEQGFLHAHYDTLYIVATDQRVIEDWGSMPQIFKRWLMLSLAVEVGTHTEDRNKIDDIKKERDQKWFELQVWDAQQGPAEPRKLGAWNRSRSAGRMGGRLEGGQSETTTDTGGDFLEI